MRFRLIKPKWGKNKIAGPQIVEGDYDMDYITKLNRSGYNAYFFPNYNSKATEGKYLKGKEVDIFEWCFVDMDLKDGVYETKEVFFQKIAEFPIEPTRLVDSGNGVHAYWRISNLTREQYIELQFRLITHFNTDASVWTVLQLMRVPGSLNTKKETNIIQSQVVHDTENLYTFEQLCEVLPELTNTQEGKMQNHLNKLDGIMETVDFDALDSDELPEVFERLLETDPKVRRLWTPEHGQRSDADWKLAHVLFDKKFHKLDEALPVLLNTQKALSKGNYRREYAYHTISKVWRERETYSVPSVAEMKHQLTNTTTGARIVGPPYFDCTVKGWRKTQVLGMVAGSGVGKTTATLDIMYEIMKNNPETDDHHIFFTLEMPAQEIIERWEALVGPDSEFNHRLHVVANEDVNGVERHVNLQKIFWFAEGIQNETGKEIGCVAIDHIGIVDRSIDVSKSPTFGIMGEDLGFGTTRQIPFDAMTAKFKELAKKLNCFLIVQSQTTKGKGGQGDTELGVDAAFGTAKYEWYMDHLMTFWQPLRRVENETALRVLGWQYAKIRHKQPEDKVKVFDKKVLKTDLKSGKLSALNDAEMTEFKDLEEKASKLREMADKKKGAEYSNSESGFKKLLRIVNSGDGYELEETQHIED